MTWSKEILQKQLIWQLKQKRKCDVLPEMKMTLKCFCKKPDISLQNGGRHRTRALQKAETNFYSIFVNKSLINETKQ
jgi:hypothetical protein